MEKYNFQEREQYWRDFWQKEQYRCLPPSEMPLLREIQTVARWQLTEKPAESQKTLPLRTL